MRNSRHHAGQAGQAYAEYQVLYPAGILLAVLAAVGLGGAARDLMGHGIEGLMYSFLGGSAPPPSFYSEEEVCVTYEQIETQSGGSFCEDHEYCDHLEPANVEGCEGEMFSYCAINYPTTPDAVVIKAGRDYQIYIENEEEDYSYTTEDGCYLVTYTPDGDGGGTLSWSKNFEGSDCKDASHLQIWNKTHLEETEEQCVKWEGEESPWSAPPY